MAAFQIAVYSPVRGSGVTTIAANLFGMALENYDGELAYVDCDLEFPTAHLFFTSTDTETIPVEVFLPDLMRKKCILCNACAKACVFKAIRIEKTIAYITVDENLCRACGACLNTCRYGAINEKVRRIGTIRKHTLNSKASLFEGELTAEPFFAVKALQRLKASVSVEGLTIIDAQNGTDFSSLESFHRCDLMLFVIDQFYFEESHYSSIFEHIGDRVKKAVGVINRGGQYKEEIAGFCNKYGLEIVGMIPNDAVIPKMAVNRAFVTAHDHELKTVFLQMLYKLLKNVPGKINSIKK